MDNIEKLKQFKKLLDEGLITEEEYNFKKNEILGLIDSQAGITLQNVPAKVDEVVKEAAPVVEEVTEAAPAIVEEVVEEVTEAVPAVVEEAVEEVAPVVEEVTEAAPAAIEEVVEEAAPAVVEEVTEAAPAVVEEVTEAAPAVVEEVVEEVAPVVEEVTDVEPVVVDAAAPGSGEIDDSFIISDMKETINEIPPVSQYTPPASAPDLGQAAAPKALDPAAAAAAEAMAAGVPVAPPAKKKSKTGLIIGIVAAVLLLAVGGYFLTRPKVESISAVYNGSTDIGHSVTADDITVTATYDNGKTGEVTGEVEEYVLHAGNNDIKVTYGDLSTYASVNCPLMANGQYVASVDDIQDAISSYASENITGFSGFTLNPEVSGSYNVNGITGQDMSISFTKQENGQNIAVEGSEIPDTVIVTSIMSADAFGDEVSDYIKMGASIYASIDPSVSFESAWNTLKDLMSTALENASGSIGTYSTVIGDVKIYTTVLLANNKVLLIYSFQEP